MIINNPEYLFPIILVVALFILKIVVDKRFEKQDIFITILETTIDVCSLAISFLISYIIQITHIIVSSSGKEAKLENEKLFELCGRLNGSIILFVIYIFLLIAVIIIHKRTSQNYRISNNVKHVYWGLLGYLISIPALWYSIILLKSLGGGI